MADVLSGNVRSLHETLRSKSPHRASRASQLSSDLYQLCVESVSDTELGELDACLLARDVYTYKLPGIVLGICGSSRIVCTLCSLLHLRPL